MINFIINFIYKILRLRKIDKNKVLLLSRQSDTKSLDFSMLEEEIYKQRKNANVVIFTMKMDSGKVQIFKNIKYVFRSLYELSNTNYCIIDSYNPVVSCIHKDDSLRVIQIWHALGAIKKFGYQTIGTNSGRSEKIALKYNMHKNYDYIISGSEEMTKYFSKAFNYDKKYFRNYGLPRIDYLRDNKDKLKKKIYNTYPELNSKKINILYAPTFRTYNSDKTKDVIECFNSDKYNLIIKSHMIQKLSNSIKYSFNKYSAVDMLSIADYVITDYSAIAIEASVLDVKTLYYVYDYEEYKKDNGLNIDLYKEMPKCVYEDIDDIKKVIDDDSYNIDAFNKYKDKYLPNNNGKTSSKLIINLLFGGSNE